MLLVLHQPVELATAATLVSPFALWRIVSSVVCTVTVAHARHRRTSHSRSHGKWPTPTEGSACAAAAAAAAVPPCQTCARRCARCAAWTQEP